MDNCSTDGSQDMVITEFPDILYIRSFKNIGADARNLGLKKARGEIIITLDDDIFGITDKDIHFIVKRFESEEGLGALNFKVVDAFCGRICNWVHHCEIDKYSDKEFVTYEITEGAVAFRKSALTAAGYYPDGFFLSHEGPDLALRILNKGYSVVYTPGISVVHHHSKAGRKNWLNYYYDTRNLLWLAARNLPLSYAIGYLFRGLLSMLVYSVRDGYLLYWIKAILEGVNGLSFVFESREPINRNTLNLIKRIDKRRPSLAYMARDRLLRRTARL